MAKKDDMIETVASLEQIRFCRDFLNEGSIANRGDFDGDEFQQLFGLCAQIVVGDLLGCPRPKNDNKFDGGVDLVHNDITYDVKCEIRSVDFKPTKFVHNFCGHQKDYNVDRYIFVNYNKTKGIYQICGWIAKKELLDKADFFPFGMKRERTDGTFFTVEAKGGLYEVKNKHLRPMSSIMR